MHRLACLALVAVLGCAGPTGQGVSGAAELACARYRTAVSEASTLTREELRERLQDIHRLARNSGSPALSQASEDMLAGITQGDFPTYESGVDRFDAECRRL